MFGFGNKKRIRELEEKTHKSFSGVSRDIDSIGKWVKHLDKKDKQVFDMLNLVKEDLSSIKAEIESLRGEGVLDGEGEESKQLFKKLPVLSKQTAVEDVQEAVQTAVQTDNFYGILKGLSGNERLVVFTLMNSDLKLSYEDLALLLGKERSTVRGQVNAIKQKAEGLILEILERNGKKRIYVPEEIKAKLARYAKVRTGKRARKK